MKKLSIQSYQAHPWHGINPGDEAPQTVNVFIEIVPNSTLKYEVDKTSGLLTIDRPQRFSSLCPMLYGFIPGTYCSDKTARIHAHSKKHSKIEGDRDPLDICILTSHEVPHGGFLARAIPVGGFALLDRNEVDDKIIAVLVGDPAFGKIKDLSKIPDDLIQRLSHYFLSYKTPPGENKSPVKISKIYGKSTAHQVIKASIKDYFDLVRINK